MTSMQTVLVVAMLDMLMIAGCFGSPAAQSPGADNQAGEVASPTQPIVEQNAEAEDGADVEIPHIHGLGFSPDGRQLIVPAHDGLRIYAEGKWSKPDIPAHDYMGYTPSSDGFYSSGHPNPSSGLVNPFGLIKSTDQGKTLVKLGFEGESDFHFMAVGYQNHAIYVGNAAANSTLPAGIHYSLDDGKTWQQSAMQGITAQPIQMAVHPIDANVVAMATEDGVWLSTDYGNSFTRAGDEGIATAVTFSSSGQTLFFGYQSLSSFDIASQQTTTMSAPTIAAEDAISNIAVNPLQPDEMALATFNKDIYLSQDGSKTWTPIAEKGKAR